jgi:hypothetical protein
MGGQTTTTQNSTQQSQTQPWTAAQPQLMSLLGQIGSLPTAMTPAQSAASQSLVGAAAGLPSFAPQAEGTASTLLAGGGASSFAPIASSAYSTLQGNLAPFTAPAALDPMSAPGLGTALSTLNSDITNQVNDQFAAAGRDLSPGNTTALARGLSQGEGGLIANQYNADATRALGAAGTLYNAGNTTAGTLSGLNQTALTNELQGAGLAGQIPALATGPAQAWLNAATAAQNLPGQNLAQAEGLLTPLARLGSETSGTSQGTTTQSVPLAQQLVGGAIGTLGLLGQLGMPPGSLGLLGALANLGGGYNPDGSMSGTQWQQAGQGQGPYGY